MINTVSDLKEHVETKNYLEVPLYEWRGILAKECYVYVLGENYIAKRFDQINYKFCEKNEAREILIDNLYAILRFRYFKRHSDEVDERINLIVKSFVANLKTTLIKVSLNEWEPNALKLIPDYCIAFANGVYNFKDNCWFFKYDIYKIDDLNNEIYLYDDRYIILWYFTFNFTPLKIEGFDLSIYDLSLDEFIAYMKEYVKTNQNYCFKLLYNMSHDEMHKFSRDKFLHLCELIGYMLIPSFVQEFAFIVGSGGNGKNSLFDGCFTSHIMPMPAALSLREIENNDFATGTLENKAHNICLDIKTVDKQNELLYTDELKKITGSMYQNIHKKGVQAYSGFLNLKFLFSINEQDRVRFVDTTDGFRRRINMLEIFYHWDESNLYLKRGDYYETTFSDNYVEIKSDIQNTVLYIYFGMYGLLSATKNFTKRFSFTLNDWNLSYSDVDFDLKESIDKLTFDDFIKFTQSSVSNYEAFKVALFDMDKERLYKSRTLREVGCQNNYAEMLNLLNDDELRTAYFLNNDVYLSVRVLQLICKDLTSSKTFTATIKKIYNIKNAVPIYNNNTYIKISFRKNKLKIISE